MGRAVATVQQVVPLAGEAWSFRAARIAGFTALLALASQIRVPVPGTDVPMTLQLIAVLLTGFLLRPLQAAASVGLFLALGSAGLPVFSPGSTGILGGTGGYLVGFLVAAVAVSLMTGGAARSNARLIGAGLVGTALVFGCGLFGRVVFTAGDINLSLSTGFLPFAPKALVELAIAVSLVRVVRTDKRQDVGS